MPFLTTPATSTRRVYRRGFNGAIHPLFLRRYDDVKAVHATSLHLYGDYVRLLTGSVGRKIEMFGD